MDVRQNVVPQELVIAPMRGREIIVEGTRNNDCVNLAIVAWADHGPFDTPAQLCDGIYDVINEYLLDGSYIDTDYLEEKCDTLMHYLPEWARSGDVYDYVIS